MAKSLYDEFKVNKIVHLESSDIYALTRCYMPILGMDSYSLYIGLSTCNENELMNYKKLMDMVSLSNLKSINQGLAKLEGIGLLKEYQKEESIVYYMNKPLELEEFLREESLRVLLISEIGEEEVLKLLEKSTKKAPVGYKDVTKKFDDVFEISFENDDTIWKDIFGDKKTDIVIENKQFNYTLFEMLFDTSFMKPEVLNDRKFKENIIHLSFVYQLDENQMQDVVMRSLDLDKELSYTALAKSAKAIFQSTHEVKNPRLISQDEDEFMDSSKDDNLVALCAKLESKSYADTLEELSGMKPAVSEIDMFDQLYHQSNLTVGAINLMIMMASTDKEGVLPGLNYFEKIANTWARANVKNAYDAFKFTEREKEKKKASMAKGGKKAAVIPAWYQTYLDELNKQTNNDNKDHKPEISQDIIDAAKELFGE